MEPPQEIPEILKLVSREKFRRRIILLSRVLAFLLIFSIFFIGFIQIKYIKEINSYRTEHGSKWSCYVCGLENGRSCNCNYIPQIAYNNPDLFNKEEWFQNIAEGNVMPCENRNIGFNFSV